MAGEMLYLRFQRGDNVVVLKGDAATVRAALAGLQAGGFGRLLDFFADLPPVTPEVPPASGTPQDAPASAIPQVPTASGTPQVPPASAAPLVPIGTPARSLQFVVNALTLPTSHSDFAGDIDGDGNVENQFGNFVGALSGQGFDLQGLVDQSTGAFASPLLITVNTEQADLTVDQRVDITVGSGTVVDAGLRTFRANSSPSPVGLMGVLRSGHFDTSTPSAGDRVATLLVPLALFAGPPVAMPIKAARPSFNLAGDGSSLNGGQIHGGLADVAGTLVPGMAESLTSHVAHDPQSTQSKAILALFDTGGCTNPDNTIAKAGDGVIDVCEILVNPLIRTVLTPDIQLFDGAGRYFPTPGGSMKDSLSIGLGFTAITAHF